MGIAERWRKHMTDQDYKLSVVDSDGDKLLEGAPIRADTPQSAWERAIVIAFRACQSSGALPMTITINAAARQRPGSNLVIDREGDLIFKSE
jgi:hypothetical protein